VPRLEKGFADRDGPQERGRGARAVQASLAEIGGFAAREIAKRAPEIDEQGVSFVDGRVVQPPALLANIDGLRGLARSRRACRARSAA
jgi:hypothetical protein